MTAENLLVNDSCYWQAIEAVRECLPQLDIVSAFALVVETWGMHIACWIAIVNHLSNKDSNLWHVSLDQLVTSEVKYNFNYKFKWTLLSIYLHSKVLEIDNDIKGIYLQIMVISKDSNRISSDYIFIPDSIEIFIMKLITMHTYHKCDLCLHTRDCLWEGRSSQDTWFYKRAEGKLSQGTVCRDPRNLPGIDS